MYNNFIIGFFYERNDCIEKHTLKIGSARCAFSNNTLRLFFIPNNPKAKFFALNSVR